MINSRAEVIRAFALAAVLIGLPAGGFAQTSPQDDRSVTGAPRTLGQPDDTGQEPQSDDEATTLPEPPTVVSQPERGAVTVAPLGASEGAVAGTLDSTNGGFDQDLWSNMDRNEANMLVSRMPSYTRVRALRSLARRLLATKAASPVGDARHSFLTIRLQKLLEGGFIDEAGAIAAMADIPDDAEFARVQADAILYANRASDACGNATKTRLTDADPFWIELRAYCYAVTGNSGLLDLTRSVMDAQGLKDPAFDTLLDDVMSKKSKLPGAVAAPTSLDVFLLRQAGLPVLPSLAKQLGGTASLLAMRDKGNSPNERIEAGERAIFTGAVSRDELKALADAASFSPDQLQHALDVADGMPFLKAEALLRQAGMKESDPSRKVQLVLQALQLGQKNNLFAVAAVLQHEPVAAIKPAASMRSMAPIIARALLLAGDADAAERWMAILDVKSDAALIARLQAESNLVATTPARAAAAQKALAFLATQLPPPAAPTPNAPAPNAPVLTPEQALNALMLGVYAVDGEAMPPQARAAEAAAQNIEWPGRRPTRSEMDQLDKLLDTRGAKGQALATILDIVGEDGPRDLAPDITLHLATGLVEEGLADTARSFAIDALLLKP